MKKTRVQHRNSKKKLRISGRKIVFLITLFFSLIFLWNYTKPSRFPIRTVKVLTTNQYLDRTQLQKLITPYLTDGFFRLNVFKLKKQLAQFPWIFSVSLKRVWPDTLEIKIIEQTPILRWNNNRLINIQGEVFVPLADSPLPTNLPLIIGPEDKVNEIFDLYKKASPIFATSGLIIKKLIFHSDHYWEFLFDNKMVVFLKESSPLSQIELLIRLYQKITVDHQRQPKSIDLRYKSGLAVKW